jgi:hypothetical protein
MVACVRHGAPRRSSARMWMWLLSAMVKAVVRMACRATERARTASSHTRAALAHPVPLATQLRTSLQRFCAALAKRATTVPKVCPLAVSVLGGHTAAKAQLSVASAHTLSLRMPRSLPARPASMVSAQATGSASSVRPRQASSVQVGSSRSKRGSGLIERLAS